MVRTLNEALKNCNWNAARYSLRFIADLVNCHVIDANSVLQLFDNLLDAAKEDGVPEVSLFPLNQSLCYIKNIKKYFYVELLFVIRFESPGTYLQFSLAFPGWVVNFTRRKSSSLIC